MDAFSVGIHRIRESYYWTYPKDVRKMFCQWGQRNLPSADTIAGFPNKPLPPIISSLHTAPATAAQDPSLPSQHTIGTAAEVTHAATKGIAAGLKELSSSELHHNLVQVPAQPTPAQHWSYFATETQWWPSVRWWSSPESKDAPHNNNITAAYIVALPWMERPLDLLLKRDKNYVDAVAKHNAEATQIELIEAEVEADRVQDATQTSWIATQCLERATFTYPHDVSRYKPFSRFVQRQDDSALHTLWVPHSADYFLDPNNLRTLQGIFECRLSEHLICTSNPQRDAQLSFSFDDTVPSEYQDFIYFLQLVFPGQLPLVLEAASHPEFARRPAAYASFFPPWSWCNQHINEVRSILSARLTGRSNPTLISRNVVEFYCANHGRVDMTKYFSMGQFLDGDSKAFSELEAVVRHHPVPFRAGEELGRILHQCIPDINMELIVGMFPPGCAPTVPRPIPVTAIATVCTSTTAAPHRVQAAEAANTTQPDAPDPAVPTPGAKGDVHVADLVSSARSTDVIPATRGTKRAREVEDGEPEAMKRTRRESSPVRKVPTSAVKLRKKHKDDHAMVTPNKSMNLPTPPITPPQPDDASKGGVLAPSTGSETNISIPPVPGSNHNKAPELASVHTRQIEATRQAGDASVPESVREEARLREVALASSKAARLKKEALLSTTAGGGTSAEHGLPAVDLSGLLAEQERATIILACLPSKEASSVVAGTGNPEDSTPTAVDPFELRVERDRGSNASLPRQEASSAKANEAYPAGSAPTVVDPVGIPTEHVFSSNRTVNMASTQPGNTQSQPSHGVQRVEKSYQGNRNQQYTDRPLDSRRLSRDRRQDDDEQHSPERHDGRGHRRTGAEIMDMKREMGDEHGERMWVEPERSTAPRESMSHDRHRGTGTQDGTSSRSERGQYSDHEVGPSTSERHIHWGSNQYRSRTSTPQSQPTPPPRNTYSGHAGPSDINDHRGRSPTAPPPRSPSSRRPLQWTYPARDGDRNHAGPSYRQPPRSSAAPRPEYTSQRDGHRVNQSNDSRRPKDRNPQYEHAERSRGPRGDRHGSGQSQSNYGYQPNDRDSQHEQDNRPRGGRGDRHVSGQSQPNYTYAPNDRNSQSQQDERPRGGGLRDSYVPDYSQSDDYGHQSNGRNQYRRSESPRPRGADTYRPRYE